MMDMEDMKSFDPEDLDWHFLFSIVSDTEQLLCWHVSILTYIKCAKM